LLYPASPVPHHEEILDETGASLKDNGKVIATPYADGLILHIPWAGHPSFLNAIGQEAYSIGICNFAEAQDMVDRGTADALDMTLEEVIERRKEKEAEEKARGPQVFSSDGGLPSGMPPEVAAMLMGLGAGES
jgi:hypothetical protein